MKLNSRQAAAALAIQVKTVLSSECCSLSAHSLTTKLGQRDVVIQSNKYNRSRCYAGVANAIKICLSRPSESPVLSPYFKKINALQYPSSDPQFVRIAKYSTGRKMIVYSRIAPNDSPAIAKHLLEEFYVHEPFGGALGLKVDEVKLWYPQFLEKVLNYYEPVSFVAKDSETNEICGAAINIIMDLSNRAPPPSMKDFISKEKNPIKWQICTFLEDLEEGVDAVKELGLDTAAPNKLFVCLFLSVSTSYGLKGIAKTLLRESEQEAKQLGGVTSAMTDVTSHFSYLAVKKLGYDPIKEVKYMSYKDHDGVPIFEGRAKKLGVHTHARVMAKKLL